MIEASKNNPLTGPEIAEFGQRMATLDERAERVYRLLNREHNALSGAQEDWRFYYWSLGDEDGMCRESTITLHGYAINGRRTGFDPPDTERADTVPLLQFADDFDGLVSAIERRIAEAVRRREVRAARKADTDLADMKRDHEILARRIAEAEAEAARRSGTVR